jgi:hypothetical protein
VPAQGLDDIEHQFFGRGRARGQPDGLNSGQPCRIDLAAIGDQMARQSLLHADFP